MKAAVLREFGSPLEIQDIAIPKTAEHEVLIKVDVCGVCHSDVHIADGDWIQLARIVKKPLVLGHEIVGTIVEARPATGFMVGDTVGVPWVYWTCGKCEFCREGNENLCTQQQITGVTVDGGYAQFVKAPATHAVKIPPGLTPEQAAPLLCAGLTVHRAIMRSRLVAGHRLAVFGVGGLGHMAVQVGRKMGADVIAIDISDEKLALAKSCGAGRTFNAAQTDVIKELRSLGGAHVAMVTSAAKTAYDMAFYCVRPTGTLLAVGLPAQDICFPPIMMAAREIHIQASAVGTRQDLNEILAIGAAGNLRSEVTSRPLEQANEVLDQLRRGQVSGRVVLKAHA